MQNLHGLKNTTCNTLKAILLSLGYGSRLTCIVYFPLLLVCGSLHLVCINIV